MNIENLVQAVEDIIIRPDKTDLVMRSVRATITQLHTSGWYSQDLTEDTVIVNHAPLLKIPTPQRFRRLRQVVPMTEHGAPIRTYSNRMGYEIVDVSDITTVSGELLVDIAYLAGSAIVIRAQSSPSKLFMQYYAYPQISDPKLETWITAAWPELVINGATARVYSAIRQKEAAQEFQQLFMMDYNNFLLTAPSVGG